MLNNIPLPDHQRKNWLIQKKPICYRVTELSYETKLAQDQLNTLIIETFNTGHLVKDTHYFQVNDDICLALRSPFSMAFIEAIEMTQIPTKFIISNEVGEALAVLSNRVYPALMSIRPKRPYIEQCEGRSGYPNIFK